MPTSARPLLAALAQMAEGVIVADAEGKLVYFNAAAARMHGVDTLGVGVEDYARTFQLLTEDGEPYPSGRLPLARAVLNGESVMDERWRIRRPDGRDVLTIGSARPVFDEAGVQFASVLTMRDDSVRDEHTRLKREHRALEQQLRDAFAQSPRSTVIYDAKGKPLAVNRAFERLWGATMSDVPAGYTVLDDPQLVAAGATPALRKVFGLDGTRTEDGAGAPVSFPALRYDMSDPTGKGHTLWTQAHAFPVRNVNGDVERVILTHEDVTARREAELARERTFGLQALTAALSRASTVSAVAEAIVAHADSILRAAGIVVASPTPDNHLELVCASHMPDELREAWKKFPIDSPVPIGDVARTREPLYIASRDELQSLYPGMAESFELAGHHATAVLPLMSNDRIHGVMGAAFETPQQFDEEFRAVALTLARLCAQALERARLYESEHAARTSAEQANRAKSEFLAVMSHELRTPLNAIAGYAELIELGIRGPVTDEMRKDLQRIQKSQRHLLGLVNGVLNYSRVEAGAVTYDLQDVMLDEVLASCEALVRAPQVRNKKLTLRYEQTDPSILVRADAEKLQQVLLNVLTNAIKFTEPGGKVDLSCVRAGDEVLVSVSDTGKGIADDQKGRVFEPFVQVDARLTRTQEGVGLGLAISRDLARGMGGDLTVESVLGKGSTFTLSLPLSRET